ncbi:MAG TPA: FAD-dependent oxidoreductase [Polyangia bacterium]
MAEPLRAALVSRTPLCEGIVDLRFSLIAPSTIKFAAGQFVTLSVGQDERGIDLRRSYSIASPSHEAHTLRFILRLVPGGPGSDFFERLPLGAEVAMTGPHGFFVLAPRHAGDVVFGATGTGIAAVLPMLGELAARQEDGRRFVYWGLRHERDLFLREEIEAACAVAGAELSIHLSQPEGPWHGPRGRITAAILAALPSLVAPTFYLVGNGLMITELKRELVSRGVERKKQIRTESFFD